MVLLPIDPKLLPIAAHALLAIPPSIKFFIESFQVITTHPVEDPREQTVEDRSTVIKKAATTSDTSTLDAALVPGIIRNYVFLLFSTIAFSSSILFSLNSPPVSYTATAFGVWRGVLVRRIRWSLAVYHIGPIARAAGRLLSEPRKKHRIRSASGSGSGSGSGSSSGMAKGRDLGGPLLHLSLHSVILAMLVMYNP